MPAFLVALAVSAVLLFAPSTPSESAVPGTDKVVHFLIFATLVVLGHRARLPLVALLVGLVAYAGGSELVQHLEPHRDGSVSDGLTDLVGIAGGTGLALLLARRRR